MKTWWILGLVAALAPAASAQEAKTKGGEQKVVFEQKALPVEAEVTVDRLNVRMFPKADQTSIITSVLGLGEKVTIVGEREDFFQILPPKGSLAWVFGKNIRKEGALGTATSKDVPVRIDSRVNADTLAVLKEGETVKIVGEHMGWFKIESPNAVKYFVGKKYVRPGKSVEPVARKDEGRKPAAEADAQVISSLKVAEALLEEQRKLVDAQELDKVNLGPVVSALENARDTAQTAAVKAEAQRLLAHFEKVHRAWTDYRLKKAESERDLAERLLRSKETEVKPVKKFIMEGYVDTVGLIFNRPGTHKLIMGGKIVCFLRAKEGDDKMPARMNDQYQKLVGVNGTLIQNPEGWDGFSVVVVEEISPITK